LSIIDISEVLENLRAGQTLIGLDLGEKTIGVAVSDLGLFLANPRPVVRRTKFTQDADKLLEIFVRENAGIAVIGLPLNMDGSSGPRVQSTRAFIRNMTQRTDMPFIFWDERLSTVAAQRSLIALDVSRAKRAQRIDSAAAAFILQGVLDRLRLNIVSAHENPKG